MKFLIAYLIACTAVFGFYLLLVAVCRYREQRRERAYRLMLRLRQAEHRSAVLGVGDEVARMRGRVAFRVENGSLPVEAGGIIPSPETEVEHLRRAGVL